METGKLGQALTTNEVFELVRADLQLVETEIGLESVASVEAVTTIGQYLYAAGGKRLRPQSAHYQGGAAHKLHASMVPQRSGWRGFLQRPGRPVARPRVHSPD